MSDNPMHNTTNDDVIDAEIIGEPRQAPPPAKRKGKIGWVLVVLTWVFIGGIFSAPYAEKGLAWFGLNMPNTSQSDPAIAALETAQAAQSDKISQLTSALNDHYNTVENLTIENAALKAAVDNMDPVTPLDTSDMDVRLTQLETDINALKTSQLTANTSGASPLNSAIVTKLESALTLATAENAALAERVALLEASYMAPDGASPATTPQSRMLVAASSLYRKLEAGQGYQSDLTLLEADLNSLDALQAVTMGAALPILRGTVQGVVSKDALANQFQQLIPGLYAVKEEQSLSQSWLAKIFTVRRTDATATGLDAHVRTIQAALMRGDLATVDASYSQLTSDQKDTLKTWHARLIKRRDSLAAINSLFGLLANNNGTPAP